MFVSFSLAREPPRTWSALLGEAGRRGAGGGGGRRRFLAHPDAGKKLGGAGRDTTSTVTAAQNREPIYEKVAREGERGREYKAIT